MKILILGAKSDIAYALAKCAAEQGQELVLAARDESFLQAAQADLHLRYHVNVATKTFDATEYFGHAAWYKTIKPSPDVVVVAFGYLGSHENAMINWSETEKIIHSNYMGAVSILNIVAAEMAKQKRGVIVGISSVAGDRGRQSNYIYGSAKAGFTEFLSGLRNRFYQDGVHVITVKPGFVRTKMTQGLNLPDALTAEPSEVAESILRAIKKKKNVIYVKPLWRWVMLVIIAIPESIFKKLKL